MRETAAQKREREQRESEQALLASLLGHRESKRTGGIPVPADVTAWVATLPWAAIIGTLLEDSDATFDGFVVRPVSGWGEDDASGNKGSALAQACRDAAAAQGVTIPAGRAIRCVRNSKAVTDDGFTVRLTIGKANK